MRPPNFQSSQHTASGAKWQGRTSLRRAASGFTLIELLVVMSIIAVVAAVALPVFATARHFAKRGTCAATMHQAAVALILYTDDYDGAFPTYLANPSCAANPADTLSRHDLFCQAQSVFSSVSGHSQAPAVTWVSLTIPYALGYSDARAGAEAAQRLLTFHCPEDDDRQARPVTSYEFKMWLSGGASEAEIPSHSDMAMLWEQWAFHTGGHESEHDRRAAMNVVFVDGHARWTRLSNTASARYGAGPDLHWVFPGNETILAGSDIAQ